MFPDYHLHTSFSSDSDTPVNDVIKKATSIGMNSICITDHYDMNFPINPDEPELTFDLDLDAYKNELLKIKSTLNSSMDLKIGIELGVMSTTCQELENLLKNSNFDFVIASSHIVNGLDPYNKEYFYNKTDKQAFEEYFETIQYNVKHFKNYNVYGHLDYVVRYGKSKSLNYHFNDYYDLFKDILTTIIHDGKGIEINTGGLYAGLPFAHPHPDLLKLYKELGGEIITVGSDAHITSRIGYEFDYVKELLLSNGFKYYCTYCNRKPAFNLIETA